MEFEKLLKLLNDKYVVIWAQAMKYYWIYRATVDMDLMVDFSNEEFKKLEDILKQNNVDYQINYISEVDISQSLWTVLSCDCWWEIQLIQAKYSWQKDAVKNFVSKDNVRIVDIYYLIILKIDAHWFRDLEDIKLLLEKDLNINKLCKIIKKYNFHRKYSKILNILGIDKKCNSFDLVNTR